MTSATMNNAVPAAIITTGTRHLAQDNLEDTRGDSEDICHPFTGTDRKAVPEGRTTGVAHTLTAKISLR